MAIIQTSALVKSMRGGLGNLVFRQVGNRTIMAGKPDKPVSQSELQRENRSRFKHASAWAKGMMLDPEKKAYYWRKAKKLKLPNAYTAAVSDYMRKGEIKEVDTRQYKGKAGDVIRMKIHKKDFAVNQVKVVLLSADGIIIESNNAIKKDQHIFIYKATHTIEPNTPVTIRVMLCDHAQNIIHAKGYINVALKSC